MPLNATIYDYNYYLSDNLGNTRYTLSTLTTGYQQDDYYPFGMDINTHLASPKNEYLYNKKELQEEFTEYDYGARFYDPVVARWTSVDPLAEISRRLSPYNYVENNPIRFIDPDGMSTGDMNMFGGTYLQGEDAQNYVRQFQRQAQQQTQDNDKDKKKKAETGSYTITFENGKTYSGKGSMQRAKTSARRVGRANKTTVAENGIDWTPAENDRQAFKDENDRINENGGAGSDDNYNKIESPGAQYAKEDKKKAEADKKKFEEPDASSRDNNTKKIIGGAAKIGTGATVAYVLYKLIVAGLTWECGGCGVLVTP